MKNVGIIVTERCQASSVFTIVDLLIAANFAATQFLGRQAPPFEITLIGLRAREQAYNGYAVAPLVDASRCRKPDIVLLPGAFEAVAPPQAVVKLLSRLERLYPLLQCWHKGGTLFGSVCTGNFLLARAGLSAGRTLACHWASQSAAKEVFPQETFVADRMLIDHGDIITAGGALAVTQLVLYLLQRTESRELALGTAKLMMVEPNFESQSRFAIFLPPKDHGDSLVRGLQELIECRFKEPLDFSAFANTQGISERHLSRRFKQATGETPSSYLQRVRLEKVKTGLEMSSQPFSRLVWEVGYEDLTSFRRLFKRYTGMTMKEYRDRFSG